MSYNAPTTVILKTITKTFTDFAVAGLTANSNLLVLPADTQIISASLEIVTAGDLVGTQTLSAGWFSQVDTIVASNALTSTAYTTNTVLPIVTGTRTIVAYAISTVNNLNTNTQGSYIFRFAYLQF